MNSQSPTSLHSVPVYKPTPSSIIEHSVTAQVDIPDDETYDKAEDQIDELDQYDGSPHHHLKFKFSWKKLWAFTGPGFLMSIAYLDPGNIASDLQAGAQTGYKLLWVLLLATILGLCLQLLSARLGIVTGNDLAETCREKYPKPVYLLLWAAIELAIIASDIQEVIGSAIALNILTFGYLPIWAGVLITAADTFTFLFLENYGIRKLEVFFCFLILVMSGTFGYEYYISKPDQVEVLIGCVYPRISNQDMPVATAMVGAIVMPHNLYLHSSLVQSRKVDRSHKHRVRDANIYTAIESSIALGVSFLINLFVVAVFAAGFHGSKVAKLEDAADALENSYGFAARIIWAIGLLAAGQSSTMTGTYAGQVVMGGFLQLKIKPWQRVLLTRSLAIVPAVLVSLLASSDLGRLDNAMNVCQSLLLPFAVLPVLKFTADKNIMGDFANHKIISLFVWVVGVLIIVINIYLTLLLLPNANWFGYLSIVFVIYLAFCVYLGVWDYIRRPILRYWHSNISTEARRKRDEERLIINADN